MSEAADRRAAQKARTRTRIRAIAQELFAEKGFEPVTIVEIASSARVSVQTVFNHFASKEEMFFDCRAPWVDGPAMAVRNRAPGLPPKVALREHLIASVEDFARAAADPCVRRMLEVLVASPTLASYERNLHEEAVHRLAHALADAWGCVDDEPTAACSPVLAEVTASMWMAAVRTVVLEIRADPPATGDEGAVRAMIRLLERVLDELVGGLNFVQPDSAESVCQVA